PWDDTELWLAELSPNGHSLLEETKRKVAGAKASVFMLPKWSPDDKLMYNPRQHKLWNLYQRDDDNRRPVCASE
ncbi:hypothetical protein OS493_040466, partial [Desmophyllum pertusum]